MPIIEKKYLKLGMAVIPALGRIRGRRIVCLRLAWAT
jgi:hypothetical protein